MEKERYFTGSTLGQYIPKAPFGEYVDEDPRSNINDQAPSILRAPTERILKLAHVTSDTAARIGQRADRIFGPEAENCKDAVTGDCTSGPGELARLHDAINILEHALTRLNQADQRMAGL